MYQAYGKMGISVCQRWIESFEKFLEDMGERPSKYYSIDRINTNGDYEPSNCRWATAKEQANNRNKRIDSVKNINCLFCKKEFRPKRKETKYCSSQCFGDSIRKMTTI
jgi:hypothetical protein